MPMSAWLSICLLGSACHRDLETAPPASTPAHAQADADAPPPSPNAEAPAQAHHDAAVDAGPEARTADEPEAPPAADASPAAADAPAAAPALVQVEGATLTVGGIEADGLEVAELVCAIERAPLMGTLVLIGSLAKQDAAFDRCAPAGDAVIVHWTFDGGRVRSLAVDGGASKKVDACVAKAMAKVVGPFDARCGAVLRVGGAAGADRGVLRLRAAADVDR
ncbi:MAG: hypothetical protein IPH07_25555 [Deltaproteobacteria bacterium]|nr:hypothetical protein [Deltaproteobacteria bacterium]MBK8718124.1 hypothetical protein [Deltaproteobacteria bacterium]